jgi:predicted nucleotidyltransferase component of viral defense system
MSKKHLKNLPASVRQKLLNVSRNQKVDFQRILGEYAAERTLWRLQHSKARNTLVFKGGRLINIWLGRFRGTRDMDFSAHRQLDKEWLRGVFLEIAGFDAQDGMRYDMASIRIETIRTQKEFQGLRLTMDCYLEQARIPLQIDVGFNLKKSPDEHIESIQSIIDMPSIEIIAYSRHAVIGEKLLAAVTYGEYNSRMKDFYDIVMLSRNFDFSGSDLAEGIKAAFSLDSRELPLRIIISVENAETRWKAFLRKSGVDLDITFTQAKKEIEEFVNPCLAAVTDGIKSRIVWKKDSVWETCIGSEDRDSILKG